MIERATTQCMVAGCSRIGAYLAAVAAAAVVVAVAGLPLAIAGKLQGFGYRID